MALALERVRSGQYTTFERLAALGEAAKADSDDRTDPALPLHKYQHAKAAIDESILASDYVDVIYDELEALLEETFTNAGDILDLEIDFGPIPQWALDSLQENADDLSFLIADRDRATLVDVLENAFLSGTTARDTAAAMKTAFGEGIITRDSAGTITRTVPADSYFAVVARTELQRAAVDGQVALFKAAGVESVRWQAANPCDECDEADDVVLPIDEDFPGVDVSQPPAHPNCRCVLIPADDDLGSHRGTDDEREAASRGNQPLAED